MTPGQRAARYVQSGSRDMGQAVKGMAQKDINEFMRVVAVLRGIKKSSPA